MNVMTIVNVPLGDGRSAQAKIQDGLVYLTLEGVTAKEFKKIHRRITQALGQGAGPVS